MTSTEFQALRALSAKLGSDSRRTQAAGGNTSLKQDGLLWIKASGTWLAHALEKDIMVPVRLPELLDALASKDPRAEACTAFVDQERNATQLRPSIETSVHAVIPHAVVAHIHCVETIALAIRKDAEERIGERLAGLPDVVTAFIPYRRPGLPLADGILERLTPDTNVLILGNHGLVVAGASVAEVEDRLERVCAALAATPRGTPAADLPALEAALVGSDYRTPADPAVHGVAIDPLSKAHAGLGSLYPDHVIFLGPGIVETEDAISAIALRPAGSKDIPPPMLLLPGLGLALHRSTTPAADAMARCLWDVVSRVPAGAPVIALTSEQDYALTHWEAETYRQELDARAKAS